MDKPLSINTLEESVAWLTRESGVTWTANKFFNWAVDYGCVLRAAVPPESSAFLYRFEIGEGLVPVCSVGWKLGELYPVNILQLWTTGRTSVSRAAGSLLDGEYYFFNPPLAVTVDDVKVPRDALLLIHKKYKARQSVVGGQEAPVAQQAAGAQPPEKWSRGLKSVAYCAARVILNKGEKLTGLALLDVMTKDKNVRKNGDKLEFVLTSAALSKGEDEIKESTVSKDWRKQLEELLSPSSS